MVVISFVSQKGGTGKTSTALNLAVEALAYGLEVVVVDLDPQVSACDWKDTRGDRAPLVASVPVPHVERTLKAARENGAGLVIIDTAGRTDTAAAEAAKVADLVYVPLQPSLIDLRTLSATLGIIDTARSRQPVQKVAIMTRVKAIGSRHDDTAGWLAANGIEVCPVTLGERVVYQDAYASGQGVSEAEPNGKAAQEIRDLYMYTSRLVGLPTSRIV